MFTIFSSKNERRRRLVEHHWSYFSLRWQNRRFWNADLHEEGHWWLTSAALPSLPFLFRWESQRWKWIKRKIWSFTKKRFKADLQEFGFRVSQKKRNVRFSISCVYFTQECKGAQNTVLSDPPEVQLLWKLVRFFHVHVRNVSPPYSLSFFLASIPSAVLPSATRSQLSGGRVYTRLDSLVCKMWSCLICIRSIQHTNFVFLR